MNCTCFWCERELPRYRVTEVLRDGSNGLRVTVRAHSGEAAIVRADRLRGRAVRFVVAERLLTQVVA
jgi:hypothetical protein